MIPLPIDEINAQTPYHVRLFEKDGSYRFVTDNDVKLAVSFMYDDMIIQEWAYQLISEFSETAQLLSHKPDKDN